MEEQNKQNSSEFVKNESKPKKQSKNGKQSFSETIKDYKAEFHKIIWPNRSEVSKKTVTVMITSLVIGGIIFCMDTVFTTGLNLLIGLIV
ncbi:MAG: preprotein translocase subunit SecE [Lachnospiraceae bacterium]|nr:preprotein translocase subunit SecE [Lachnospiraceae bacterium]